MGAELFHSDIQTEQTDRQTDRRDEANNSLLWILLKRLKIGGYKSAGMLYFVDLDCLILKMEVLLSLEMSVTCCLSTRRNIQQNNNICQHRCEGVNFTFMLPCIAIDFFLNNQPDTLIVQIYFVIKLYMFRASSLPIIRSFLLYIRHW